MFVLLLRRVPLLAALLTALPAALATGGCAPPASDHPLERYLAELEQLAGPTAQPREAFVLPPYPDGQHRRLVVADVRIGLGEFLDLKACGLRADVAARNSALGKLEPASRRLAYEHRLLTGLEACLAGPDADQDDADFRQRLADAIAAKRESLAPLVWNATFGSAEFAALYRSSAPPLPVDFTADREPVRALQNLTEAVIRLGEPGPGPSREGLVRIYRVLEQSEFGARLVKTAGRSETALAAASVRLDAMTCGADTASDLRRLEQIWSDSDLRIWLENLQEVGEDWHAALDGLLAVQVSQPPEGFRPYHARILRRRGAGAVWPAFVAAVEAHEQAWRRLAARCGPWGADRET